MTVSFGPAFHLRRDQGDTEAFLAPARGISGIHDTDREIGFFVFFYPGLGFKGIGMIIDEIIMIIRSWIGQGMDFDRGPSGIGKMDRPGRELLNGVRHPHFSKKTFGIGFAYGMGNIKQKIKGKVPRLFFSPVTVHEGHHIKEVF